MSIVHRSLSVVKRKDPCTYRVRFALQACTYSLVESCWYVIQLSHDVLILTDTLRLHQLPCTSPPVQRRRPSHRDIELTGTWPAGEKTQRCYAAVLAWRYRSLKGKKWWFNSSWIKTWYLKVMDNCFSNLSWHLEGSFKKKHVFCSRPVEGLRCAGFPLLSPCCRQGEPHLRVLKIWTRWGANCLARAMASGESTGGHNHGSRNWGLSKMSFSAMMGWRRVYILYPDGSLDGSLSAATKCWSLGVIG